jgi:hypothetical protein
MNTYKFDWDTKHPIDYDKIRSVPRKKINKLSPAWEDLKSWLMDRHNIQYIMGATPEVYNSEFCAYTNHVWAGYPAGIHKVYNRTGLQDTGLPEFSKYQKTSFQILHDIFPQFYMELEDVYNTSKSNRKKYDPVKHLKNASWHVTTDVEQHWTHTITAYDRVTNRDIWYYIQAIYRGCIWHNQFESKRETQWELPICIFAYTHDGKNFFTLHPGNTRAKFMDFQKIKTDIIFITPKNTSSNFPKLDKFNYIEPIKKLDQLLDSHNIEYTIDEETSYSEIFCVSKKETDLNDGTVLFFGEKEDRSEFIDYCRQINRFHNQDIHGYTKYPKSKTYNYELKIELKDSNIFIQGEKVAYLDDDAQIRFYRMHPKYFLNLF